VHDARIIEQQRRPRLCEREAYAVPGIGREDARLATEHAHPVDQHDRDVVDAVAMRPLRRGPPDPGRRVDPELVRLDVPGRLAP
jgi:hypothetical protein